LRSAQRVKSSQGYALGQPPLGYKRDPENSKRWVGGEEGAAVVRMIYAMRLGGVSVNDIAKILRHRKVLTPSAYARIKGFRNGKPNPRGELFWDHPIARDISSNRAYLGDVINFRTYSRSYKLKKRLENPAENWDVHENVHNAIIERTDFETVQHSFGDTKYRKSKHIEQNMFAGLLDCSDCGAHLVGYFQDKFVKVVVDEHYRQVCASQRKTQKELAEVQVRDKEINRLYEKIYEDQALGRLPEERF
jgi:hypothetical protein